MSESSGDQQERAPVRRGTEEGPTNPDAWMKADSDIWVRTETIIGSGGPLQGESFAVVIPGDDRSNSG